MAMARRSHNETFILLRNNAQKNRSFYRDFNKDDERVKLVSHEDDNDEVHDMEVYHYSKASNDTPNGYRHEMTHPTWISNLDEFNHEAFNIRDKIDQLKKIQNEHLKQQNSAIFADEVESEKLKSYEFEIDRRCQELNVLFNRLHSILMHFQTLKSTYASKASSKGSNRMISSILRNIFQYQVHEVVSLTQLFRSCQRVYVDRRNEATRVDPEFVITFDDDLLQDTLLNDGRLINSSLEDSVFFEGETLSSRQVGQQQSQLMMQDLDSTVNDHLKEREKEIDSILKSFYELNQIFQEVNALVVDQGSALDRIDYNLEQVKHHVELGAVSLEKAHRSITRVRKFKVILGAGLLLFLLLLLIIVKS